MWIRLKDTSREFVCAMRALQNVHRKYRSLGADQNHGLGFFYLRVELADTTRDINHHHGRLACRVSAFRCGEQKFHKADEPQL